MSRRTIWVDQLAARVPGPRRRAAEAFAAVLEGSPEPVPPVVAGELRDLARVAAAVRPTHSAAPSPEFRAALRERLLTEAAQSLPRRVTIPAPRRPDDGRHRRGPGWLHRAIAVVCVASLGTGLGATVAAQRALPGDALYDLKRSVEGAQLAVARGEVTRGHEYLQQAQTRLVEAARLAAEGATTSEEGRQAVATALQDWVAASDAGLAALMAAYRETGDREPLDLLRGFVAAQRDDLQDLTTVLTPRLREIARRALQTLAELDVRTTVLLATADTVRRVRAAAWAERAGASLTDRAPGDGWAVSRLMDRAAGTTDRAAGTTSRLDSFDESGLRSGDGSIGLTDRADLTADQPSADLPGRSTDTVGDPVPGGTQQGAVSGSSQQGAVFGGTRQGGVSDETRQGTVTGDATRSGDGFGETGSLSDLLEPGGTAGGTGTRPSAGPRPLPTGSPLQPLPLPSPLTEPLDSLEDAVDRVDAELDIDIQLPRLP